MTARLPSHIVVSALLRRVEQAGGFAVIIARGEAMGGAILVQIINKGRFCGFFERVLNLTGVAALMRCGPADDTMPDVHADYLARRRGSDPDLWIVELDIADGERFAAETMTAS